MLNDATKEKWNRMKDVRDSNGSFDATEGYFIETLTDVLAEMESLVAIGENNMIEANKKLAEVTTRLELAEKALKRTIDNLSFHEHTATGKAAVPLS